MGGGGGWGVVIKSGREFPSPGVSVNQRREKKRTKAIEECSGGREHGESN